MVTGAKTYDNKSIGFAVEGLYSFQPLQLDEWTIQDTQHLVWSQSPTGEELVMEESLFKGQGVWLTHVPSCHLSTFSSFYPIYQSN